MAKKLGYEKGVQIVASALGETAGAGSFDRMTRLGNVLATPELRVVFRHRVITKVTSEGFRIEPESVPVGPDITLHDVTLALAGLPGNPDVDYPLPRKRKGKP